jgi:hypothetical protein
MQKKCSGSANIFYGSGSLDHGGQLVTDHPPNWKFSRPLIKKKVRTDPNVGGQLIYAFTDSHFAINFMKACYVSHKTFSNKLVENIFFFCLDTEPEPEPERNLSKVGPGTITSQWS